MIETIGTFIYNAWIIGFISVLICFYFFEMEEQCDLRSQLGYPRFAELSYGALVGILLLGLIPIISILMVASCVLQFLFSTKTGSNLLSRKVRNIKEEKE